MSLDTRFVRGKRTGVYTSDAFPKGVKATKPTPVTFTVAAAAAAGATSVSLTVPAGTVTLRENQILTFNEGDPGEVRLVVTEETTVADTSTPVPVDALEGEAGDGIPGALAENDTATWDRLYRVLGTSNSPYSLTRNAQNLQSVTYDNAESSSWDESETTSKSWTVGRQGNFKPRDHAFRQNRLAAHEDREVWLQQILADEDGAPAHVKEGRAIVDAYQEDPPADGIVTASWTWQGQGRPSFADID